MIGRVLLLACLASLAARPLAAELAFSVVENSTETPVNAQVQLASTAAGDTLNTLFRVRNTGAANAKLSTLTIAGSAFSLTDLPALPAALAPHAYLDFTVRFQPAGAGSFSALLKADGVSVFVLATGVSVLTVFVEENGIRRQLDPASSIDFGTVERGTQAVCHLLLVNQARTTLTSTVSTAGSAFQLASGGAATVAVAPQNLATIDVLFAPVEPGPQQGELRIDQRRFSLRGSTVEPPLPKPIIQVDLNGREPSSGIQPLAVVRFDPPPRTHGAGKLRIDFHPSVDAQDDPAIFFLATSSRSIDFAVIEGEANAQFGPVTTMPFQTGTTAGTIVIRAELGDYTETAKIEIPPQPIVIDAVEMTRSAAGIEVQVSGYDNTRSISQAQFTFLQPDGTTILPGAIQQDLAAAFRDYFANSGLGGAFKIKAGFPVTGSPSLIDGVKVVLTNAVGQTNWPAPTP